MWKRPTAEPAHSRVMRAGDPPEHISIAHADGSYSQVQISVDHDELDISLTSSTTHQPHLRGDLP